MLFRMNPFLKKHNDRPPPLYHKKPKAALQRGSGPLFNEDTSTLAHWFSPGKLSAISGDLDASPSNYEYDTIKTRNHADFATELRTSGREPTGIRRSRKRRAWSRRFCQRRLPLDGQLRTLLGSSFLPAKEVRRLRATQNHGFPEQELSTEVR
jgi:hypothetical protein